MSVHGTASASKQLASLHEMGAETARDAQRLSQCLRATHCDKLSEILDTLVVHSTTALSAGPPAAGIAGLRAGL